MKKIMTFSMFLSLVACSSTPNTGMMFTNKNPRGISILNVTKENRIKAYREAEKHCAKYYKVTRVIKTVEQKAPDDEEFFIPKRNISFECLKPSN